MSKYEEMSDEAFIELLDSKLHNASWNVGEIVELDRRGLNILTPGSPLSKAIIKKRSEFTNSMNAALKPYLKQFEDLTDSINSFKVLSMGKELTLNPRIESEALPNQETAEAIVLGKIARISDQSLVELRGIRRQSDRDWFHWSNWVTSLIAAVTSIVSLCIALELL